MFTSGVPLHRPSTNLFDVAEELYGSLWFLTVPPLAAWATQSMLTGLMLAAGIGIISVTSVTKLTLRLLRAFGRGLRLICHPRRHTNNIRLHVGQSNSVGGITYLTV
jgi:hypothetical protein